MNCSFTEKVSSLIDGELSVTEAREVERHLVGCNECQQLRADFLNLRTHIAGFETSLKPEVQNRALKKILGTDRRVPATRGLRWSFGTPAVAFATLVIAAAIIGLLFYQSFNKNEGSSEQVAQQQQQNPTPAPSGSAEQSKQQQPQATPESNREQHFAP